MSERDTSVIGRLKSVEIAVERINSRDGNQECQNANAITALERRVAALEKLVGPTPPELKGRDAT